MKTVVKENANGGKGQVVVKYILDDNELNAKCKMLSLIHIFLHQIFKDAWVLCNQ